MAYPRQIVPTPTIPAENEAFTGKMRCRPVNHTGSNVYEILMQGANPNFYLSARKSTTNGDETPWIEKDNANHPALSRVDFGNAHCFHRGDRIYCTFAKDEGVYPPTKIAVQAFNMATDLWEAATANTNCPIPDDPGANDGGVIDSLGQWASVVRANGDICCFYNDVGTFGPDTLSAIRMKKYSGGAWSATAVDVLLPVNPDFLYNYQLDGVSLSSDGERIHVWGSSYGIGYFHAVVRADDTVVVQSHIVSIAVPPGSNRGYWGESTMVTIGSTEFAAHPFGTWYDNEGFGGVARWVPCLFLVQDQDDLGPMQLHEMAEVVEIPQNWFSVNVGSYDGAAYLLWTRGDANTLDTTIRISCTRGFGWSAPSDIFTPGAGELIETLEIDISGGILRLVMENAAGESPYDLTQYAQTAVSCGATGCPAGGGGQIVTFH